jgi:biopolymer transport protein ExbD
MPRRRLKKGSEALEVSAFINLIVVLIPFLLSTAVFSNMSVLDITLPAKSGNWDNLDKTLLKLEVVVRHDRIEVGDKVGGLLFPAIPHTTSGPDLVTLNADLFVVKQKFPDVTAASLLPEPDIPYDTVIHVMDAMSTVKSTNGGTEVKDIPMFPGISIGDAPVRH